MSKELTYIHFSDLHIGDSRSETILSRVKDGLKEDIKFIVGELGHVDVVFMTGDLVQRGSEDEYRRFGEFLEEIDVLLKYDGKSPYYFFVPGNHDLERCNEEEAKKAVHRTMKMGLNDEEVRECIFWEADSDYIQYCKERFANYEKFVSGIYLVPHSRMEDGILPGDFYADLEINGIKLGVVGLNSAFLQVDGSDYKKRLGVYEKQVWGLFQDKYVDRIKENDINVLMSHHAPDWYEEKYSKAEYEDGIYIPKYIVEHLCGHNHYPQTDSSEHNNWGKRLVSIAPSLCGLEKTSEGLDRIHGYHAGKYIIDDNGTIRKYFYPRIANKKASEIYLVADNDYKLEKGKDYLIQSLREENTSLIQEQPLVSEDILECKSQAIKKDFLHPMVIKDSGPYVNVRKDKQELACQLFNERILWICTKYGLGEEQFLSSVLKQMQIPENTIIGVDCEDVSTYDGFDKLLRELFSMPLTKIVVEMSMAYEHPVLLLKNLSDTFVKKEQAALSNALHSVLKYNNLIRFVLISRSMPEPNYFPSVVLEPLSQQEIKRVIEGMGTHEKYTVFDIEKISNLTNGYPLCIDQVIRQLDFNDISDLSDDMEIYHPDESVPLTVQKYIESIRNSSDDHERSIYRLLLLFSGMPKGGLFQSVKWMNRGACFGLDDINALIEHELITLDRYYVIKNHQIESQSKVLRVPKIYRDYVLSLEDKNTLKDMYSDLCKLFLGDGWLGARLKLHIPQGKEDCAFFFYYNVTAALRFLMQYSIENNEEVWFERYINIANIYMSFIEKLDLFHVALSVADDFYSLVKDVKYKSGQRHISKLKFELADFRRMNKQYDEAILLFEEVLKENLLLKYHLQICRQCLAYAYSRVDRTDDAIEIAKQMITVDRSKKSEFFFIAKYILILNDPDIQDKAKELKDLYSKLKRNKIKGHLGADIAVDIANYDKSESSLKRINDELARCSSNYTRMRLINRKYSLYSHPGLNKQINESDIDIVRSVYTFAFLGMIIPLLNESHKILWDYYMKKRDYSLIVNILTHSCVIWEMNNLIENINKYIGMIQKDPDFINWAKSNMSNENVLILVRDRALSFFDCNKDVN